MPDDERLCGLTGGCAHDVAGSNPDLSVRVSHSSSAYTRLPNVKRANNFQKRSEEHFILKTYVTSA